MQVASWISVIRDVNINKIQSEATSVFSLLLVGDDDHTQPLADALGARQGPATHGYVTQHALPLPDGLEMILPAVAIVTSPTADLDHERRETLRRLKSAGVNTIVLLIGDRALWPESAWQLRMHEDARAAIRPSPDLQAIQEGLGPPLQQLDKAGKISLMAMARRIPVLRAPYAHALAEDVARTNAGFALSTGFMTLVPGFALPLTAADIVVLTKNQIVMAYRLALAAGKPGEPRVLVGEVIGVIGAGLLFRQIARELVGLMPGVGIVPKVAVSYAGTLLVAKVVEAWAIDGRRVEVEELRSLYDASLAGGRAIASELRARSGAAGRGDGRRSRLPRLSSLPEKLPGRLRSRGRGDGPEANAVDVTDDRDTTPDEPEGVRR